jgi:hypothetical protein
LKAKYVNQQNKKSALFLFPRQQLLSKLATNLVYIYIAYIAYPFTCICTIYIITTFPRFPDSAIFHILRKFLPDWHSFYARFLEQVASNIFASVSFSET